MNFEILILGSTSAIPSNGKYLTSQLVSVHDHLILIDCGEGTQFRLFANKISVHRIEQILISHLHGDHVFGLPGLINSMNLTCRTKPLTIFGPEGLKIFIDTFINLTGNSLSFNLEIHEINTDVYSKILENNSFEIFTFPLQHRIPTYGYKITEISRFKNVDPKKIQQFKLTINQIKGIKYGQDVKLDTGEIIPNDKLTLRSKRERSYAYCSDTLYDEGLINHIRGVDLLYHEATYLDSLQEKAHDRYHSTASEAAMIAKKSKVKKLLLGHFSSRYGDLQLFIEESKKIFNNVELAIEGSKFAIPNMVEDD